MALTFLDGCGAYKNLADVRAAGQLTAPSTPNTGFLTTGGRFGGGCIVSDGGPSQSAHWVVPAAFAQGSTVFLGVSLSPQKSPTGGDLIAFLGSSGTVLGVVGVNVGGTMYVKNQPGTVLQTTSESVFPGLTRWARLEAKFVPGTTASNGSIEVRMDGITVLSQTGIDTLNGSETLASIALFGCLPGTGNFDTIRYDDITINDNTGSVNNDYLGDIRIEELVPSANGNYTDWSVNTGNAWDALNDTITNPDDDTTYIFSNTVAQRSTFAMTDLAATPAAIQAVRIRGRGEKTDAGTRSVQTTVRSSTTDSDDATGKDPGTSYNWFFGDIHEVDPATSVAWTASGVNAMEAGVVLAT